MAIVVKIMKKIIVNEPDTIEGLRVVQDGKEIYKALQNGESVMHWEAGNSMHPLIMHMEYCLIEPAKKEDIRQGEGVFCKFRYINRNGEPEDFFMVHRCTEIYNREGELWFKIESTDNQLFGWTKHVYGRAHATGYFQDESVLEQTF